ncbi:unnamed protein product, partial [Rotaria sp. Silwood1]
VSDDESVNKAKFEVKKKLENDRSLNCLINNAGVKKAVTGERNVLQASIINISTTMSSITIASTLSYCAYDYQCSRAALNMYTVCLATELAKSNIFIALLHPGWVQTDMERKRASLNIDEASKNIINCITAMKNEHYGKLIDSTSGSKCDILPF